MPKKGKRSQAQKRRRRIEALLRTSNATNYASGEASVDPESPDFFPSLFEYSEQDQDMEAPDVMDSSILNKMTRRDTCIRKSSFTEASRSSTAEEAEEFCTDEQDAMIPLEIYNKLQVQHQQLMIEYIDLCTKSYALQEENNQLKEELCSRMFSFSSIRMKAQQMLFFTGLSTVIFEWLLSKLKGNVPAMYSTLSLEDHLLVVLMKLRLGLRNEDIALRFAVTENAISNILRNWIRIMAQTLKPMIKWPTRNAVLKKMPKCFQKKYRQCRCIIDYIEVFIETPRCMMDQAQTWSNYKHRHTVKYLVGLTPAGAVCFLSPGWGGSVSVKEMVSNSGFFELLEPMDKILAIRGFPIREDLVAYQATLHIPHFKKSDKQLCASEAGTPGRLSNVRIHLERVIGRLKKFTILTSVIPRNQEDILGDMVTVCGALTNLCQT
ncbi:uncharacterized protein LOC130572003 isoform X2 [Triplophysa rosa]|uniref:DDE Tnp4 domain-containing protein n=1 Tax=Triplophysa rosa TaxID=992332 RepID=A0A9W7WE82_TRIRA|nr:uncharacterized protein LOC130572003 isoform X2 [Triplophysa rosa]XP_057219377.1 uncharacterized protein LOC130572003 isoform X2 [Triplophysa rosa]XP_057219378.1 uncharacterized protein LOC130572003 isoform X2 [Triplophysa rosa]KAI7794583.1 hypothetical protein IRJ41_016776 [Triplophysa rosa]